MVHQDSPSFNVLVVGRSRRRASNLLKNLGSMWGTRVGMYGQSVEQRTIHCNRNWRSKRKAPESHR